MLMGSRDDTCILRHQIEETESGGCVDSLEGWARLDCDCGGLGVLVVAGGRRADILPCCA